MSDHSPAQPISLPSGTVVVSTGVGPVEAGRTGIYVRTETRSGDPEPMAFVLIVVDRVVNQRWTTLAAFPDEWAAEFEPPAAQAETAAEQAELRSERDALVACMKSVEQTARDLGCEDPIPASLVASLRTTYSDHKRSNA